DYDTVDRILLARPHYLDDRQVHVTKFIPTEQTIVDENDNDDELTSLVEEETFKIKYECLVKQFEEYKETKENEVNFLRKE
ncbi:unnamed protein product, partial [Adineta steineri]